MRPKNSEVVGIESTGRSCMRKKSITSMDSEIEEGKDKNSQEDEEELM
jgi:hypothetical protein